MSRLGPQDAGRAATYQTLEGASRAAAHLVELGYGEGDVRIAPAGFHTAPERAFRRRITEGLRWGGLTGGVLAGALGLGVIGGIGVVGGLVVLVVAGAGIGISVGLVAATVAELYERRTRFGPPSEQVIPERFVVVLSKNRRRADHDLARWWDVAAKPKRPERAA